jgi:hypothetical protein
MSHSVFSFHRTSAFCAAMLAAAGPVFAAPYSPSTDPVFKKMLALNHDLGSYTAHIDVKTRVNILSFSLHGTLYAKGERTKVQFDNVPGIAKSSVENQPSVSAPSTWPADYEMSIAVRDATTTIYHLVPRASDSPVTSVDVTVANASGLVQRYLWTNVNGSTIASDQTYASIEGHELPISSSTDVRGKGINSKSETTFSNYQLNVEVPDAIFAHP